MALGSIIVELLAKTGSFETDLGRAAKTTQKRMKEIETSAEKAGRLLGSALKTGAIAAGTAIVAGLATATVAIEAAIQEMDQLNETAQKIGIPVEVLSGLKYAAEQSGVEIEQLQTGLGKLIKFQQDAAQGGKDSLRVFETFGIAIKDVEGNLRGTEEVLREFSDIFKALPDGPEKSALAMQIFGKSGMELIPFLNAGSDGIAEMTDRARELGLVFDAEAGSKADEFGDKLAELEGAVKGLSVQVAIELLPELIALVDWFRENYTEGAKLKETAEAIASVISFAGERINAFSNDVQALTAAFSFGIQQADAYYQAVSSLATLDFEGAANARNKALANIGEFAGNLAEIGKPQAPRANFGRVTGGVSGSAVVDRLAQARSLNTAAPKAAKASKGKKDNSAAEALREAEKAARDYQRSMDDLNSILDDQAALTGGDLTKAALSYRDVMVSLQEIESENIRLGKLDAETSASIAQARDQQTAAYQKELEEIQNRKTPAEELLADLQFENDLLKMNNEERLFAIQTRGTEAADIAKYSDAIKAANKDLEDTQKVIEGMDVVRGATENLFRDFMDDAKSAEDIFKDFVASILAGLADIAAKQLTAQLFGEAGTSGGGSAGGWLSSIFGSLFGSAKGNIFDNGFAVPFANGGVVSAPQFFPMSDGRTGLMGEAGPEAIMPLRRGADGKLGVASSGGSRNHTTNININMPSMIERRTAQQTAQRAAEKQRVAVLRNN